MGHEGQLDRAAAPGALAGRALPRWVPPPVPDLSRPSRPSAAPELSPRLAPQPIRITPAQRPAPVVQLVPAVFDDASLWATVPVAYVAPPPAAPKSRPAAAKPSTKSITTHVATAQVAITLALLIAAPLLTLLVDKPSGLAFAVHGVGATLVLVLATMAMHRAYPLMRGGARSWPAFQALVGRLALVSVAQAASSLWILRYYLHGPAQMLAQTTPAVDQFAMQLKIFGGLAGLACFVAAWWSARSIEGERGDGSMLAPAFAVTAGWLLMVLAFVLGMAITWVMPV